MYETPIRSIWDWLLEVKPDAACDLNDVIRPIRDGLLANGKLAAAPLYGESSFSMSDVCRAVDFNNVANFNRRFNKINKINKIKKLRQMTPSDFRKRSGDRYDDTFAVD